VITPPHLAPSSPPLPRSNAETKTRELTENERRLARERRMTDAQYLELEKGVSGDIMKLESFKPRGGK
jgi:hypothetical protein